VASGARDIYFDSVKALERRVVSLQQILWYARSSAKVDSILLEILGKVMDWVGADAGALFLANPGTGMFELAAAHWASFSAGESVERRKALQAVPVKLNEGIVGQVYQACEPVSLPDVSKSAVFRTDAADAAQYEIRNLLAVPLALEEGPIGVLELFNKQPKGVFSSADMELALGLAGQIALVVDIHRQRAQAGKAVSEKPEPVRDAAKSAAPPGAQIAGDLQDARRSTRDAQAQAEETRKLLASALQVQDKNAQILRDLTEENERLKPLAEAATPPQRMVRLLKSVEPFAFTLSLEKALKSFLELSARLLDGQAAQVFLWDPGVERLALAASTSPAGKGLALAFKKGEGAAGAAAQSQETVRVDDAAKDNRFSKTIDESPGTLTRTLVAAPLTVDGRLLGVLEVLNKKEGGVFTEADATGLEGLALLGAAAIDKTLEHRRLLETHRSALGLVADFIETHDAGGGGRHDRLRQLALLLGAALGLKEKELRDTEWGALLFGIGWVALSSTEREALNDVPCLSAEVLGPLPALAEAACVVRHTHERWDGQGRPDRLSGAGIPYGSRILAVVEAFDALTTGFGGGKTFPPDVALKELETGAGKFFDPACVDAFVRLHRAGRLKHLAPRAR